MEILKSWKVNPAQKESPILLATEKDCGRMQQWGLGQLKYLYRAGFLTREP